MPNLQFTLAEPGECDVGGTIYKSSFPTAKLLQLGESVLQYDEVSVFWISTEEFPTPDDLWMREHFPSIDEIVTGIETAFHEYYDEWCGRQMEQEILSSLAGEKLERFRARKWLAFLAIDSLFIQPTNNIIWLDVDVDGDLDYNLDEHGVSIMRVNGRWRFGYSGDQMEYADYELA